MVDGFCCSQKNLEKQRCEDVFQFSFFFFFFFFFSSTRCYLLSGTIFFFFVFLGWTGNMRAECSAKPRLSLRGVLFNW